MSFYGSPWEVCGLTSSYHNHRIKCCYSHTHCLSQYSWLRRCAGEIKNNIIKNSETQEQMMHSAVTAKKFKHQNQNVNRTHLSHLLRLIESWMQPQCRIKWCRMYSNLTDLNKHLNVIDGKVHLSFPHIISHPTGTDVVKRLLQQAHPISADSFDSPCYSNTTQ